MLALAILLLRGKLHLRTEPCYLGDGEALRLRCCRGSIQVTTTNLRVVIDLIVAAVVLLSSPFSSPSSHPSSPS